jgi:hypothetical protein
MLLPSLRFNTIQIVESLTVGRTGFRLYEDLEPIGIRSEPPVVVRFWRASTREEFVARLVHIATDASENGRSAILHVEAHGNSEGIVTSSGDLVPWDDFKQALVAINVAGRVNLLVVLAACKGIWLLETLQPSERASFATLIGPLDDVEFGDIERGCGAFYRTLFSSRDVFLALDAMNAAASSAQRLFQSVTALGAFRSVFRAYLLQYADNDDALAERERRILTKVDETKMSQFERTVRRGQLRTHLRDHRGAFARFKENFFFCDLFPENVDRFHLTFEDCLPSTTKDGRDTNHG